MTNIFCAIDTPELARARDLARAVGPVTGALKLGLEFWCAQGPQGVEAVRAACPAAALFLDLKLHDIPNTAAGAVRSVTGALAPDYLTLHTSGGGAMMEAARAACPPTTKLLGVTVLTALDVPALGAVGQGADPEAQVVRLGRLARDSGLRGLVCSPREIGALRAALGPEVELVVPGIRPVDAEAGDQKRVATPFEARAAGATHLVIGRPITQAPDPARAAAEILEAL